MCADKGAAAHYFKRSTMTLTGDATCDFHSVSLLTPHMLFTLKLNVNFRELKKEGHFHYKNFLRALK